MNNDNHIKKISHENHMANLFLQEILYSSMTFPEIAIVMSLFGLETTENEAMDAYDNLCLLGYPRGGSPTSWALGGPIDSSSPRWIEYIECRFMGCNNEVQGSDDLCQDCVEEDEKINNWKLINSELNNGSSALKKANKTCCGQEHTKFSCTQCHGPLCMNCILRIPVTGVFLLQHYGCMSDSQRKRYEKA